jgi:hypothetical protein
VNKADLWAGSTNPFADSGNTELRGVDTARTIAERPSIIVVSRLVNGRTIQLPPQTVRIEILQNPREANEQRDGMVAISKQYVVVIGVKDHPTLPNTDLLRADQFFFQERMYEVAEFIASIPGRLMVSAMVTP